MKLTLRGIVFSALFGAILVIFSFIKIPLGFTPVPVSLQSLAIMLAAGLLGPLYGCLSVLLVILLTAIGFPLMTTGGGIGALIGPTGGFIFMWPFAALLMGIFLRRIKLNGIAGYVSAFLVIEVFGSLLLYLTGVPWLAHVKNLSLPVALAQGFFPFLPGDAIKAAVAVFILGTIRPLFPYERLTGAAGRRVVQAERQDSVSR